MTLVWNAARESVRLSPSNESRRWLWIQSESCLLTIRADQLLDALIYLHAHERRIIHRDIKPHNLEITPTGQIVLLDFGLAKTQAADCSGGASCPSVFGYTPRYAR